MKTVPNVNSLPCVPHTSPEHLKLFVDTVQELSLARDLETVMRIVRTAARKLTGADGATFVLRDGDLCFYADEDAISPLWKGSRFPMSTCISGWAMLNRQPAVIEDIFKDDRIPADVYRATFVKSLAMVPIRTIDPIGAIGNYWAHYYQPTPDQVLLLQSLADITAVSMENIRVYSELEQRVKERTLQLEEINKELESFSYSVSHDLRSPLRVINFYSSILMEEHGNDLNLEGKELVQKIIDGSTSTSHLIDQLLVFFKNDRKVPQQRPVPMNEMVSEIIEELGQTEEERSLEFILNKLPDAVADPALIRQVWVNLISNAIKYSGKKKKALIEIDAHENINEIVFSVKDNGAGFEMKYYDKLFGAFQRLHSSDEFEGSGIGLATVQRIIQKHGGRVWAEGKTGKGACFYFSLPVTDTAVVRHVA